MSSPPVRRESDASLHAESRERIGRLERKRVPAGAKKLDDLSDVTIRNPVTNHTLLHNGAEWVNAPSVAGDIAVTEALASYTDDGIFDEVSPYEWETSDFIVAANSYQLVLVTVEVALSDITLPLTGTGFPGDASVDVPTPWKVQAYATDVPSVTYLGNGTGSCGCTVPLWLHNDTDTEAPMTVSVYVQGTVGGPEFDATVDARAESVFQMAALTP